MSYVYRYIDIDKMQCVYIGKVDGDLLDQNLAQRHQTHKSEAWWKMHGGYDNMLFQFIKLKSPAEADIVETCLIQQYDPDQLANKQKTGWGDVSFWQDIKENLSPWQLYGEVYFEKHMNDIKESASIYAEWIDRKNHSVDNAIKIINDRTRTVFKELVAVQKAKNSMLGLQAMFEVDEEIDEKADIEEYIKAEVAQINEKYGLNEENEID